MRFTMYDELGGDEASEMIRTLLESSYNISELETPGIHVRRHDDWDGEEGLSEKLFINLMTNGDVEVYAKGSNTMFLRFRCDGGGGGSLRTHRALKILAEAIRLDNEDRPQR